ncbi:MAG TPA: hypothetical protein VGS21_01020 [Acidimicrobiales bacterium]|nr:hypothetical protein [Acidimicrobiales bacterium]
MTFQPDRLLEALERHGVRFVVIGGLAAAIHGAGNVTFDVDVVPEESPANLGRLSSALTELEAKVRVDGIDGGLPFAHDARSLAGLNVLNLVTVAGDLDITMHPAGVISFEEWDRSASDAEALGVHFRLAALEDVIRSKEAADRPKDRAVLPLLREVLARRPQPRQ